jgi:hypothetical protein
VNAPPSAARIWFCLSLLATQALAEEPLDPTIVTQQLYQLSDKRYPSSAGFHVWGNGTVSFSVTLPGDKHISGVGADPRSALADLKRQSDLVAKTIIPEAERTKGFVQSLLEGLTAILKEGEKSQ